MAFFRNLKYLLVLGFLSTLFVGCSHFIDRKDRGMNSMKTYQWTWQEERLKNGSRLIWVADDTLPKLQVEVYFPAGFVWDSVYKKPGLAYMSLAMLDESTQNKKALTMQEFRENHALGYHADVEADYAVVGYTALSSQEKALLEYIKMTLFEPIFDPSDFERVRQDVQTHLKRIMEQPNRLIQVLARKERWGAHPYGSFKMGTLSSLEQLTAQDLKEFYLKHLRVGCLTVAISGRWTEFFKQQLTQIISQLPNQCPKFSYPPVHNLPKDPPVVAFVHKGLSQVELQWFLVLPDVVRFSRDYVPLRVGVFAFGGAFASRLNQVIRDDLGLTYSIYAQLDSLRVASVFTISSFTEGERLNLLIQKVNELYHQWLKDGITESELEAAKNVILTQFPASIETASAMAGAIARFAVLEWPIERLNAYLDEVQSLSVDQVNKALKHHLSGKNLRLVIYMDEHYRNLAPKDWVIRPFEGL